MNNNSLFYKPGKKDIEGWFEKREYGEIIKSAEDCIKNSKHFLKSAELLINNNLYKSAQILSGISLEELAKCKALLDFIEGKKSAKETADFFFNHETKYSEIFKELKHAKNRDVLRKQGAYVFFPSADKRPITYANEGFENLAKHETEDASKLIVELELRIKEVELDVKD